LKDNSVTASVVITTKNRREDLLKAVESVMAQRGLLEVVVIDDGTTDGAAEELKKKFSVFSSQFSVGREADLF
jgi:glycosyltransferase involved in cell wall biosynthesis